MQPKLCLVGVAAAAVLLCCDCASRAWLQCEKFASGSRYYYGDRWYGPGDRGGFNIYIGKK
jgi:hypothetical protein